MNLNRKSLIALAFVGAAAAVAPQLLAQDDDHGAPPPPPPPGHVSLDHEMQGMSKALKIIGKQVSDPARNASTLAAVFDLEQHTLAAKSVVPHSATTMPTAAENQEKLADYQATMIKVLRQELDLEEQLRASDNDKAAKTVDSLKDMESEGHHEFRMRDD